MKLQLMYENEDSGGRAELLYEGDFEEKGPALRLEDTIFFLPDMRENSRYEFWFLPDEGENLPEISSGACRNEQEILISSRMMVDDYDCFAAVERVETPFAKSLRIRAHVIKHDF